MQQPGGMPPTCRCPCNQMKQVDVLHEVERLRVETQNQQGVIDALKNQVGGGNELFFIELNLRPRVRQTCSGFITASILEEKIKIRALGGGPFVFLEALDVVIVHVVAVGSNRTAAYEPTKEKHKKEIFSLYSHTHPIDRFREHLLEVRFRELLTLLTVGGVPGPFQQIVHVARFVV